MLDLEHQSALIESAQKVARVPDGPERPTVVVDAVQDARKLFKRGEISEDTLNQIYLILLGS